MGLLSFLQRRRDPAAAEPPPPDAPPDAVALARSRARRRLIGASVLLAIGVIGFPLLFETQPRPIAVDIPIEMPQRDKAPPLVLTPAPGAAPMVTDPAPPPRLPPDLTERAGDAGQEVPPPAAQAAASAPATRLAEAPAAAPPKPAPEARPVPEARPAPEPRSTPEARPAPEARATASKPAAPATATAAAPDSKPAPPKPNAAQEAARAQALLEGKPVAAATDAASRVVVQVGAYTDADKLRQVRAKVEQMGFKTYTQVIEANGERRTRVRVGPFPNRAEADKAAARIKAAGLQAAILSL